MKKVTLISGEIQVFAKTSEQVRKRLKKEFIQNEIEAMSEFLALLRRIPSQINSEKQ